MRLVSMKGWPACGGAPTPSMRWTVAALEADVLELEKALTADNQTIRLALGEITAQEMRTVRAAFNWVLLRPLNRVPYRRDDESAE